MKNKNIKIEIEKENSYSNVLNKRLEFYLQEKENLKEKFEYNLNEYKDFLELLKQKEIDVNNILLFKEKLKNYKILEKNKNDLLIKLNLIQQEHSIIKSKLENLIELKNELEEKKEEKIKIKNNLENNLNIIKNNINERLNERKDLKKFLNKKIKEEITLREYYKNLLEKFKEENNLENIKKNINININNNENNNNLNSVEKEKENVVECVNIINNEQKIEENNKDETPMNIEDESKKENEK
jgi:hypothetical protein